MSDKTIRLHRALRSPPERVCRAVTLAMRYPGWQESLTQLAALVEPNIPDGGAL
jgi:hypothetical protein